MRKRHQTSTSILTTLGATAATAGLLGAAWYADARRRARQNSQLHRALVELLLNTLNAGDPFTERHCRRVADLTDSLACACRFGRRNRATLRVASLLHDMGKLDDDLFDIVHGSQQLDDEGRDRIRSHPHGGAGILRPLEPFHQGLAEIVESHHERWDGRGYPRGLRGDEIPLAARIISVADVFDALTQTRSYKEPHSVEEALATIREDAGSRFDPSIVEQLGRPDVLAEWTAIAQRGWTEETKISESR